jgi:hypothetical protein
MNIPPPPPGPWHVLSQGIMISLCMFCRTNVSRVLAGCVEDMKLCTRYCETGRQSSLSHSKGFSFLLYADTTNYPCTIAVSDDIWWMNVQ